LRRRVLPRRDLWLHAPRADQAAARRSGDGAAALDQSPHRGLDGLLGLWELGGDHLASLERAGLSARALVGLPLRLHDRHRQRSALPHAAHGSARDGLRADVALAAPPLPWA